MKNLAGIGGPAGHFRFWSELANHGGRRANRGRQGLHGLLRSLAHQFHPATHLEFGEQRRNMELDGARGNIQFAGYFFVSQAAEDAVEDFFFDGSVSHWP